MKSAAAALLLLGATTLRAQDEDTLRVARQLPDSLVVGVRTEGTVGPSAEDRLKAKVDSLRNALSEMSPARRKVSASLMLAEADSLRLSYDFPRAMDMYQNALRSAADSSQEERIREAMALGQNGMSMMKYCSRPAVLARRTVALEEFFLYYPMQDSSWRPSPNVLDRDNDGIAQATYVPEGSSSIYFSAKDGNGIRNIYHSAITEDEVWSAPKLTNEQLTSWKDEIYPVVSADGRTMYFASKGLYGMGGYDLYMSQWDREADCWGEPMNMGLPYSSPYDDFLFMNSDDGRYSIFASNRDCARDSVTIYVLEYNAMTARKAVEDVKELRMLAELRPAKKAGAKDEQDGRKVDVGAYAEMMSTVRALRDTIYKYNRELDGMRAQLTALPVEEQGIFLTAIHAKESSLPGMQKQLETASARLQEIEQEFLTSGVMVEEAKEEAPEEELFAFYKRGLGAPLGMEFAAGRSQDHEFSIRPVGEFAKDNGLPAGLVYQIQIATAADKMDVHDLKGLCPVFERMTNSLRYSYAVGLFKSYDDALEQLNSVRKLGFHDATIIASMDGKSITVKEARGLEE